MAGRECSRIKRARVKCSRKYTLSGSIPCASLPRPSGRLPLWRAGGYVVLIITFRAETVE